MALPASLNTTSRTSDGAKIMGKFGPLNSDCTPKLSFAA
jgi:hypothetical protein